jgi:hypothetical protein
MLRVGSVLYLDQKPIPWLTPFREHIVLVDIMDATIPVFLGMNDIVPFIIFRAAPLVIETRIMDGFSKFKQLFDGTKDHTATSDVMHSRELHLRKAPKLVFYRNASLEPSSYCDFGTSRSIPKVRLECV